ncbi:hypothetical protein SBD_5216 [Streptomyces bottropensis ATCC 25435]|uniref:Integrase n=1 Tax=Streptomyces bottropensis ATCC 25435 TaxID=1054862 RepID=M3DBG4_9ACTN|nr:hypothetical protein SBD_5216 [Streptomyces bottropensis ATCC 25435]
MAVAVAVAVARWLGHSAPAITLGYYAHFMPELMTGISRCWTPPRLSVDCKVDEQGGLRKC